MKYLSLGYRESAIPGVALNGFRNAISIVVKQASFFVFSLLTHSCSSTNVPPILISRILGEFVLFSSNNRVRYASALGESIVKRLLCFLPGSFTDSVNFISGSWENSYPKAGSLWGCRLFLIREKTLPNWAEGASLTKTYGPKFSVKSAAIKSRYQNFSGSILYAFKTIFV